MRKSGLGLKKALADARLTWSEATSYGTPRRLVLYVTDLSDRSSDITVKVRGPSRKVAYDSEGMPTKALQGFCRSLGIDVSDVVIEPEANGEYVYGFKHEPGQMVTEILPTILLRLSWVWIVRTRLDGARRTGDGSDQFPGQFVFTVKKKYLWN